MNWKHLQEMNQINCDRQHFQRILFLGNERWETKSSKNKMLQFAKRHPIMIIVKSNRNVYYMTLAFAYV